MPHFRHAVHPCLLGHGLDPVDETGDHAQVLGDMLLTDPSRGHFSHGGYRDHWAKQSHTHGNAFGMMPQGPVAIIASDGLALVEPLVDVQVIFRHTTPLFAAAHGMMIGISHVGSPG